MEWGRPKACLKVFCRYVVRPGSSEYVCYDAVKISGRVLEGAKVRNAQPYIGTYLMRNVYENRVKLRARPATHALSERLVVVQLQQLQQLQQESKRQSIPVTQSTAAPLTSAFHSPEPQL